MSEPTTRFRVWAPVPETLELVLPHSGPSRHPMERGAGGWWAAEAAAPPDARYAFSLDGGPPRPDPRSPRQPDGVHAWSQLYDHSRFRWTDAAFRGAPIPQRVTYELHVGTFTPEGTFDAAAARLAYLGGLGVTHVSLMPANAFPGRHGWGYDGVCLFAVFEPYGGPDGLKRFVDAAHAAGIGVVLDVIYNHFGPDGNYLPEFAPYLTDRYRTPWGDAPNFDGPHSDDVRAFFCDNAVMWLRDYHLDGLRLDAVDFIFDTSAYPFLEELRDRTKEAAPHATVVGESAANDPRYVTTPDRGGFGFDGIWSDDMHHALHTAATAERSGYYIDFTGVADIAKALRQGWVLDGAFSVYRGRRHGRPPDGTDATRFMAYTQTHDQVGNRALGERLVHLSGPDRAAAAAAVVLLGPANPMLFMGEEWAASSPFQYFCDHKDEQLAHAVREGRRDEFRAFGWSPDDIPDPSHPETFLRSKLDWSELEADAHARMLEWYRNLLALRARHLGPDPRPFCQHGDVAHDPDGQWVRFAHSGMTVAACFSDHGARVPLPHGTDTSPPLAWGRPETNHQRRAVDFAAPGAAVWTTR